MSIYDNIAYGCRIHGVRGKRKLDLVVQHHLESFVLAYIVYAWRKYDSKKIDLAEIEADDHAY